MTPIDFANTQRLAVGVRLPTDCGPVFSGSALGAPIMAWRCVGDRLAYHLYPVCASELLSDHSPNDLPNIRSGICLLYFPL